MLIKGNTSNEIRWSEGERLDHLFEARCDAFDAAGDQSHLAVIADDCTLTFRELDNRANQLARFLKSKGLKAGDRVGLLFDKTPDTYVALLAVLKINAAYVPLDCGFPNERIEFILEDAEVKAILSLARFNAKLEEFTIETLYIDEASKDIASFDAARLSEIEKGASDDQLAYLIYTSGTTGKPKGVIIEHASICNFVRVAAETYGIEAHDRVYQGMTIAFDFSVEELWVPLLAGATLIPGKPGASLVGEDLADYLSDRRVTVLACVPTLLATIERDLPDLRILLVSGEACPHGLVSRWHQPGRVILNAYGPTEATVTATLTELYPEKPVTIGGPLPTYTIVVLDEHEPRELADGETGEIAIAGIGLAAGYLNRDDLTAKKFIPDFLNIPNNPSGCIYRTGDLGRINADGEVEFLGRIDTQVKLRGYRIELTEIESVLLESPDIAQAVVDVWESEPGTKELVAYVSLTKGVNELCQQEIGELLRSRVPAYMVPSYLEQLPVIPMTVNDKADRKKLPAPRGPRFTVVSSNYEAPTNEIEEAVAEELCIVLNIERASIDDHFFQDLGGHSLLMARLCTALRRRLNLADVSMRDVYLNPSVRKLSAHLSASTQKADVEIKPVRAPGITHIPSDLQYLGCGVLQMLFFAGYGAFGLWLLVQGFQWTYPVANDTSELYLRVTAYIVFMFALFSAIPVAAKWLLIGRWKEESIPIWSLNYFRFWVVKSLIQSAPLAAFRGTPLFNLYLRMLGAKIGKGTVITSGAVPVCTDMLTIGSNAVLRRDSIITGYKAQGNVIYTGPVSIGDNAFVGEASVIDTHTVMEDNTQLGHASSLHAGQLVPEGKTYHGSPAIETAANYNTVEPMGCGEFRRWAYTLVPLAISVAIFAPVGVGLLYALFPWAAGLAGLEGIVTDAPVPGLLTSLEVMVPLSLILLAISLPLGLISVIVIPRIFARFIEEGKTYRLFGVHYFLHGVISAASNSRFYNLLFGDSSAIVHYLPLVGYNLN
nr:amino acid adenylation domain-containing protein [Hyphomicrobiales bacterium]